MGQAKSLRLWVLKQHPLEKAPTEKTIKNNIRHDYNAAYLTA